MTSRVFAEHTFVDVTFAVVIIIIIIIVLHFYWYRRNVVLKKINK